MSKSNFIEITLEEAVRFSNGKSIKPGGMGNYPVYGANGIIGRSNAGNHYNAIIIGRVGAYCGSIKYCETHFWASDNTIVAYAQSGFDIKYLYYLLKYLNLNRYAGGAAQPLLTQTVLRQVHTRIPSLPIQRKIAAILSAYDDLIENNTRRIEILEEMARSLYREWFVNFRFPRHEQVKMIDSELGPVPEGWEAKKIKDVMELVYGKSLIAKNRKSGKVPVYGSAGVIGYHDESLVKSPGVIVGRKGNVGSVFWSDDDFFPIDTVFYVQTKVCLHYVYYNLQNQNFINNDAAVPGLSRNQAYSLPFLLPSENLLKQFQHFVNVIFKQNRNLRIKNDNLRLTRDLLLPKLISGEIDVTNLYVAGTSAA